MDKIETLSQTHSVRGVLERTLAITILTFISIAVFLSVWLAYKSAQHEDQKLQLSVQTTLGEMIKPSLTLSDYMEVRRVLTLLSKKDIIFAVVTNQGDVLLSNDSNRHLIEAATHRLKKKPGGSTCELVSDSAPNLDGRWWNISCSPLDDQGILLSLKPEPGLMISIPVFIALALLIALILVLSLAVLRANIQRHLVSPLESLVRSLRGLQIPSSLHLVPPQHSPSEILELYSNFNDLLTKLNDHFLKTKQLETAKALGEMAQQVAHDIRSPLAALEVVGKTAASLEEEQRILLRQAIARIHFISQQLRRRTQEQTAQTSTKNSPEFTESSHREQLLGGLLEAGIAEARVRYIDSPEIAIHFDEPQAAYGLFGNVDPALFRTVISNLIDNAIEASPKKADVQIRCFNRDSFIVVTITDKGAGIDPIVLPLLMERGATFGKPEGSGLGLYHARQCLERWGGQIQIESTLGKGTTVVLSIPRLNPPSWFVPAITLPASRHVVIADDDPSIHAVWKQRLKELTGEGPPLFIDHFFSPQALQLWLENEDLSVRSQILFLCDYEFVGYSVTGLELIESNHLVDQSILVTSSFENPTIEMQCSRLHLRLLPKSQAPFVPLLHPQMEFVLDGQIGYSLAPL